MPGPPPTPCKRANQMLGLTGRPFWQEESYDHLVRHAQEFERIRSYIEQNPVRAGLVAEASQYRWSSAGWATRGSNLERMYYTAREVVPRADTMIY